ncbi:MAG TPA: hypothetical protein PK696_04700 [bacterium]|nr:hypothetical protein [bacterium]HQM52248.1 hypothetical protein [bacterium]
MGDDDKSLLGVQLVEELFGIPLHLRPVAVGQYDVDVLGLRDGEVLEQVERSDEAFPAGEGDGPAEDVPRFPGAAQRGPFRVPVERLVVSRAYAHDVLHERVDRADREGEAPPERVAGEGDLLPVDRELFRHVPQRRPDVRDEIQVLRNPAPRHLA